MKAKNIYTLLLVLSIALCFSCNKEVEEPEPDPREVITGSWFCDQRELGDTVISTFKVTVSIIEGTNDGLNLSNFGNLHGSAKGYLNGDKVDIPEQYVNSFWTRGNGNIFNKYQSNWVYSIVISGDTIDYIGGFKPI